MISNLNPDVKIILLARGLRSFAFSNLNVVFAIYLSKIGYSTLTIGIVHSVAYISGAILSALWGFSSDRLGRKKILILLSVLTILSTSIYIFSTHLAMILLAVVLVNVGAGGTAGGGQGGGPFNPVEQAFLAEKCKAQEGNRIFGVMGASRPTTAAICFDRSVLYRLHLSLPVPERGPTPPQNPPDHLEKIRNLRHEDVAPGYRR